MQYNLGPGLLSAMKHHLLYHLLPMFHLPNGYYNSEDINSGVGLW